MFVDERPEASCSSLLPGIWLNPRSRWRRPAPSTRRRIAAGIQNVSHCSREQELQLSINPPRPRSLSSAPKKCRGTVGERFSGPPSARSETFPSGGDGAASAHQWPERRSRPVHYCCGPFSQSESKPKSLRVAAEGDSRCFQVVQVRSIVGNAVQPPPPPLCMSHTWFRIVGTNKRGSKTVS